MASIWSYSCNHVQRVLIKLLDITLVPHNFSTDHSRISAQLQKPQTAALDLMLRHTMLSSCCNEPPEHSAATQTTAWLGQVAEGSD